MSAVEQKDSQEAKGETLVQIIDGKEHRIHISAQDKAECEARTEKTTEQAKRDHARYLELLKLPFDKRKEAYAARCGENKKLFLEITNKLEMFTDGQLPRDYSIVLDNGQDQVPFEAQEFMGAYRDVDLSSVSRGEEMGDWTFTVSLNKSKPVMPFHEETDSGDDAMPALVASDFDS